MTELVRALAAFAAAPGPSIARVAGALEFPVPPPADHHALFGADLPPYASIYLGAEGMLGGEARDRVAGFWRALGRRPPAEPDHLATLLGALAALADDRAPAAAAARRALLWEHLLSWLPPYLDRAAAVAPDSLCGWVRLLSEALDAEAAAAGPPEVLPAALREAAPALDADAVVANLLAPVRCGFVLTRTDLRRAAADLRLGVRQADRGAAIRSLLGQDPGAVLGWLADFAAATAERLASAPEVRSPVAAWWSERAAATAEALRALATVRAAPATAPLG